MCGRKVSHFGKRRTPNAMGPFVHGRKNSCSPVFIVLGLFNTVISVEQAELFTNLLHLVNKDVVQPTKVILGDEKITHVFCAGTCLKQSDCIAFSHLKDGLGNLVCKLTNSSIVLDSPGSKVFVSSRGLMAGERSEVLHHCLQ
jgi:hypothetical protein